MTLWEAILKTFLDVLIPIANSSLRTFSPLLYLLLARNIRMTSTAGYSQKFIIGKVSSQTDLNDSLLTDQPAFAHTDCSERGFKRLIHIVAIFRIRLLYIILYTYRSLHTLLTL